MEEMAVEKQKKFLTVAPFECVWLEELRFREAGRGCVVFEASSQNDVTLVFREQAGSKHHHYKVDNNPNYTIILGSHRNRRLKIQVNGKTVVDVAGMGLCCSSAFQSYWISICDGLISIGKGKYPFQDPVYEWLDSQPNCNLQYIGLSSWDKHVGYRNVRVLPLPSHHNTLWSHMDYKEYDGGDAEEDGLEYLDDSLEKWGLHHFLENRDLSDVYFIVGDEKTDVPAHRVILSASGDFSFDSAEETVIHLPSTSYSVLHAFLEYIYTGRTEVVESQLCPLLDLGQLFKVSQLVKKCEEIIYRFKMNKKLFDSGKKVEILYMSSQASQFGIFPYEVPVDVQKLKTYFVTGEHSDTNIIIEGYGLVARSHKLILSLWSQPFAKMFTTGMNESRSSDVLFNDISAEAFLVMLRYMYSGELELEAMETNSLLIPLLLLADQFMVTFLQRECCKRIMECLSEDSVCTILRAVSSVQSYRQLEETCKKKFAMHFDFCTTASTEFVFLDEATFKDILQHSDMTVTSEEKVLDGILMWCMQATELYGWAAVDELISFSTPEQVFGERLPSIDLLLPFVRFSLMQSLLLEKLEKSRLASHIPMLEGLIKEAIGVSGIEVNIEGFDRNIRFQHRRSSYRELQYICDGDKNGVVYFAGTSYGQHPWVNPVLAKNISVTASSPDSRYTGPKALVSRAYQATSFAGPRIKDGQISTWWMVDIGQDHQLMCNYYTIRQDGSSTYMRSWVFQGSMDGESWTNLRVHENDQTICQPGQFASWPVIGPPSLLPFRFFRVLLTAPAAGYSNAWNLCICFIELYGYFR